MPKQVAAQELKQEYGCGLNKASGCTTQPSHLSRARNKDASRSASAPRTRCCVAVSERASQQEVVTGVMNNLSHRRRTVGSWEWEKHEDEEKKRRADSGLWIVVDCGALCVVCGACGERGVWSGEWSLECGMWNVGRSEVTEVERKRAR